MRHAAKNPARCRFRTLLVVSPVSPQATNKFNPSGGVMHPTNIFAHMIIPKCTRSIPICWATGARIGVSMAIEEFPSINIPTIKNMIFTRNRNTNRLSVNASIAAAIFCGTRSMVKVRQNGVEHPIIRSTMAVPLAASHKTLGTSLIFNSL